MIGNRWTLERVLGRGASATVYAARDPSGTQSAIKILSAELGTQPDVRARFLREREAAASIDHPGVVRAIEQATTESGEAYLVMELLEGETLAERVERQGAPPVDTLLLAIDQVLDTLAVAHAQGIVHRDLKPGNLFVTTQGQVKLLDFGVARLVDPAAPTAQTRLGLRLGTIAYMAPEQAQGKNSEVDGRSDLFALGAVMFRLLTGRRVHEARTDSELAAAMATQPAPPVASVATGLPPEICSIIDVALSFSKDARYPDARAMQTDVRAVLAGQPPPHAARILGSRERATMTASAAAQPPLAASVADTVVEEGSLEGQVIAERYRIERLLGSGGMGAVYQGTHVHMRKTFAVKVLHREMTVLPEVVARFEREAVAAAKIEHPNVAAATDFGQLPDGSFYLILEFIEGESLRAELDTHGAMPAARALHIAAQIVAALAAAHACKIVHRDLKPENVMLVERMGDRDFVKVLDFGIAKLSAEDTDGAPALTQMGSVFGTPEYMSPEQARGESVDSRSDLYTVGILLYEMLCGKTPFASDETIAVLTAQMTEPPPPLPASIDPKVTQLVMRQLAKNPAERVQTADELLQRLDTLIGVGQADTERPPPSAATGPGGALFYGPSVPHPAVRAAPATSGMVRPSTVSRARDALVAVEQAVRRHAPVLQTRVQVAGRAVPLWSIAVAGLTLGLLATVLLVEVFTGSDTGVSSAAPAGSVGARRADSASGADQAARQLARQAAAGQRVALATLQKKPPAQRTVREWHALGRGYAVLRDYKTSVASYAEALKQDAELKKDRRLLADVRQALTAASSHEAALRLCKTGLGSAGPDLLYQLWTDDRKDPERKQYAKAAKAALGEPPVRGRASAALQIALKLQETRGCNAYRKRMPEAAKHADARSLPALRRLQVRRGCGFLGLGDCYSCLRGNADFSRAIQRAADTPAPSFLSEKPGR